MPGLGLRIHPNTDDPTLHQVTPTQAWLMMVRDFGFGLDDLRGFMHNGLDGAWIDEDQRRAGAANGARIRCAARAPARTRFPIHRKDLPCNRPAACSFHAFALCAALALRAQAPAWPAAKPITLIVPYTAGGSVDATRGWWRNAWRAPEAVGGDRERERRRRRGRRGQGGGAAPDGYTLVAGPTARSRSASWSTRRPTASIR
jgi:hypothetical protein